MAMIDSPAELTVLCAPPASSAGADPALGSVIGALRGQRIHQLPTRIGPEIDVLLSGRILVIGSDADLAAVVTRLDRRELLRDVVVAYAPLTRSPFAVLWSLPSGAAAVRLATYGDPDLVPLARSQTDAVLVGETTIGPVRGLVELDGFRMLNGPAKGLVIQPDQELGLAVTVVPRRIGIVGRRPVTRTGRQLTLQTTPATLIGDGFEYPDPITTWGCSSHPTPLRLVRGIVD